MDDATFFTQSWFRELKADVNRASMKRYPPRVGSAIRFFRDNPSSASDTFLTRSQRAFVRRLRAETGFDNWLMYTWPDGTALLGQDIESDNSGRFKFAPWMVFKQLASSIIPWAQLNSPLRRGALIRRMDASAAKRDADGDAEISNSAHYMSKAVRKAIHCDYSFDYGGRSSR